MSANNSIVYQVQWDETISGYTEQRLREIFSVYGRVVDVISRPSKRKGKGSALIVMADSRVCTILELDLDLACPIYV